MASVYHEMPYLFALQTNKMQTTLVSSTHAYFSVLPPTQQLIIIIDA